MPNYSIAIKVKNHTTEIENKLRLTFGINIVDELSISESGTLMGCYQACKSNDHFGCVHWTEEDLQSKFHDLSITITAEILDIVKSSYLLRHIDDRMIELGWEVIEQAIVDAQAEIDQT